VLNEHLVILFHHENMIIEDQLRTGVGENKPIADLLQTVTPQYLLNMNKSSFIPTMLNGSIVYIDSLVKVNEVIAKMSTDECKQVKVSNINGIGPFWLSIILKKESIWFTELNNIVTHRMTRFYLENKCFRAIDV
jgi:hypothetical protein